MCVTSYQGMFLTSPMSEEAKIFCIHIAIVVIVCATLYTYICMKIFLFIMHFVCFDCM